MAFERICFRRLPDGSFRKVYPFHVSLEGMAELALCRDDEDYDVMVKYLFVCARRKNVLVVIYIAMSNHGHATILATGQEEAETHSPGWRITAGRATGACSVEERYPAVSGQPVR